jgi:hypothetical protein
MKFLSVSIINTVYYLPLGHSFMHCEQPPAALRKEQQAYLFILYCSPASGSNIAFAGHISRHMPQLAHSVS